MCVSEKVTFGWDCVGVCTSSVGDESVTGMCCHHFSGLLSSRLIAFLQ